LLYHHDPVHLTRFIFVGGGRIDYWGLGMLVLGIGPASNVDEVNRKIG
jgi:hypothetical protein